MVFAEIEIASPGWQIQIVKREEGEVAALLFSNLSGEEAAGQAASGEG